MDYTTADFNGALLWNPDTQQAQQYYSDINAWGTPSATPAVLPWDSYAYPETPTSTPPPDPYAKWGGQDAYNNLVSGFSNQKQNIIGTANDAAANSAIGRQSSILDFIDSLSSGQRNINEQGVQNELARKQGYNSITDMVGQGLRSGGVLLANKNASDSSAAEGIAKAYSRIGQRELNGVNNQYEQKNRQIGLAQEDLAQQKATGLRKFDENKLTTVNSIVADARNSLAALDAQMLQADMPTRIQIEQEKAAIKDQVLQTLSQYDQMLTDRSNAINPSSTQDRRATAFGLANAGVAASSPFDFSTQAPAQFQNTGPSSGTLPLFTTSRRRTEN